MRVLSSYFVYLDGQQYVSTYILLDTIGMDTKELKKTCTKIKALMLQPEVPRGLLVAGEQ